VPTTVSKTQRLALPFLKTEALYGYVVWADEKICHSQLTLSQLNTQRKALKCLLSKFQKIECKTKLATLPLRVSPSRNREWSESRKLVSKICSLFVQKNNFQSIRLSLTHTVSATAAIVASQSVSGIGIDIESFERKIDERIAKRVKGSQERYPKTLKPIDIWCAKEAAFKAHPKNKGLVLSDFVFCNLGSIQCKKTRFKIILKTVTHEKLKYRIAIAIRVL
jgi:phosphopantetheinyl transferase